MATLARPPSSLEDSQLTSARNVLPGIVTAIAYGGVNAEVGLLVNERTVIDALVSNSSVEALELEPGGRAIAMIKASFVTLIEARSGLRYSEGNLLGGKVVSIVSDTVQSEVVLDIGDGCEIAAVITTQSALQMNLGPGSEVLASFNPSHVTLVVEEAAAVEVWG